MNKIVITGGSTLLEDNFKNGVEFYHNINPTERFAIGTVAAARIQFSTDVAVAIGSELTYSIKNSSTGSSWRRIGIFYVTEVEKQGVWYAVTAYDGVSKLNREEEFVLGAGTIGGLAFELCQDCGLPLFSSSFTNSSLSVPSVTLRTASYRDLMGFICELAGGFAYCRSDGKLIIANYATTGEDLGPDDYRYVSLSSSAKSVPDDVYYRNRNGWYHANGSGTDPIEICYNPLILKMTATSFASSILSQVQSVGSYYTGVVYLPEDIGLMIGQKLTIDGKPFIVMTKEMDNTSCRLYCTAGPLIPTTSGNIYKLISDILAQL